MNPAFLVWLVGLAMFGAAIGGADAGEVRLSELLENPASFDGRQLVLHGTLTKLQANVSRRGDRYYTFQLAQHGHTVIVVAQGRSSCKVDTVVRVQGRFDGAKKRVDAATVSCE